ncbi:hypothetical protein ACFPER_06695 [Agromyces aurantiacus]|uniref:Integral membrane protein n=1 Tax=Agromyces aurantiacus TaxID=165814 RepID=A0ABV9R824_9MICO|nr:hypothetical protein [Agromyces aurantiacus]MBM7503153.1 hypothetical protein [Agromyces aurantiacus]
MESAETRPADAASDARPDRHDATAAGPLTPPRPIPWWAYLLIGVGSALIGLLPWIVTGMRLPLQNLWATQTLPQDMPIALLPFSQYMLTLIVAIMVTGATIAGIVVRATRARRPRSGVAAALAGLLAVQVVAVVQSAVLVEAGLEERSESTLYLAALVAIATLSVLVGVLVMLLVASAPKAGAVVGLSIAAVASVSWFTGLIAPRGLVPTTDLSWALSLVRWIPPVIVGAAIAWAGLRTVGRVLAALFGLVLLWVAPALVTGVSNAAGSRVLAKDPQLMIEYAVDVFGMALTMPSLVVPPLVVAVVVAVAGLVGRAIVRRARNAEGSQPPGQDAPGAGSA